MLALTYPPGARVYRCQDCHRPQIKSNNDLENLRSPIPDESRRRKPSHRPRRVSPESLEPFELPDASTLASTSPPPGRETYAAVKQPADRHRASSHRPSANPANGTTPRGSSCPKDRSQLLQIALILALLVIGCNRHSGPPLAALALGSALRGARALPLPSAPIDANDPAARSERSANLTHITGPLKRIQMYVKNRHLQILPDGTVNGSNDDTSDFTILQRTSTSRGRLKIQGVATCLYLCMDSCGLLYGSREQTEDCIFNEMLESHNYNTYSSVRWSTPRKTLYLGLSRQGQPRRVQANGRNLGRLSAYARVLTQVVPPDRAEALHRRMLGARHNVRHHHGDQQVACPVQTPQEKDGRDRFRCRKRKKRKKRRRKCRPGETLGPQCDARETPTAADAQSKRSCEGAALDEACRREALETPAKKRKSRIEGDEELEGGVGLAVDGVEKKARRSNGNGAKKGREKKNAGKKQQQQQQHRHQNSAGGKKGGPGSSHRGKKGANGGAGGGFKSQRNPGAKRKNGSQRFARTTSRVSSAVTLPFGWSDTSPSAVESIATPSSLFRESAEEREEGSRNSAAASVASTLTLTSTTAAALGIVVVNRAASSSSSSGGTLEETSSTLPDIDAKSFREGDSEAVDELLDFNDFDEDEEERDDEDDEIIGDEIVAAATAKATPGIIDIPKPETDQRLAM